MKLLEGQFNSQLGSDNIPLSLGDHLNGPECPHYFQVHSYDFSRFRIDGLRKIANSQGYPNQDEEDEKRPE
jgi:hypothetical protein